MLQPEDEVVEVFSGDTLEEAMAGAVAALGPDLSVRRARKVRKGVQGLMGKERFEVLALPAPRSEEDAVESAFDALLSQAEAAEAGRPAAAAPARPRPSAPSPETARPRPGRRTLRPSLAEQLPHPAPLVAAHLETVPWEEPVPVRREQPAAPPARSTRAVTAKAPAKAASEAAAKAAPKTAAKAGAKTAAKAATKVAPKPTREPAARPAARKPAAKAAPAAVAKAPARTAPAKAPAKPARRLTTETARPSAAPAARRTRRKGGAWSRAALAQLGVPEQVLAALPAKDPADDLAWVSALADAIASVVPAAVQLSAASPVAVHGHGVEGALGILRAAACGLPPGTLTDGARTAPATPLELALAVRAAVVGWRA